jgi:hypothetical protein
MFAIDSTQNNKECDQCEEILCEECNDKLNNNGTVLCEKCSFKKENDLLKLQLIEYELMPPKLGGELYIEAKNHFRK